MDDFPEDCYDGLHDPSFDRDNVTVEYGRESLMLHIRCRHQCGADAEVVIDGRILDTWTGGPNPEEVAS